MIALPALPCLLYTSSFYNNVRALHALMDLHTLEASVTLLVLVGNSKESSRGLGHQGYLRTPCKLCSRDSLVIRLKIHTIVEGGC